MYYRIKNKLDAEALERKLLRDRENEARERLMERVIAITNMLDTAYGGERTATSYGGYVLFFPDERIYCENVNAISEYYHLDSQESEYKDTIYTSAGVEWYEELFLLSSEDSMTFIYPRRK